MKITKSQLKQIIKEELGGIFEEGQNLRDPFEALEMLRGNNKANRYTLLNKIPAETLVGIAYELKIDIINLIMKGLEEAHDSLSFENSAVFYIQDAIQLLKEEEDHRGTLYQAIGQLENALEKLK